MNRPLIIKPRWIARLYAFLTGYFWTSCPLCGRYFAGNEWRSINGHVSNIPEGEGFAGTFLHVESTGICPVCTAEARGCKAWSETPGGVWMEHDCQYKPHPYSYLFKNGITE